jgi:hypothetical protein
MNAKSDDPSRDPAALRAAIEAGRRHHDMGGLDAGPVDRVQHAIEPWEHKTDAILRLLSAPPEGGGDPVMRLDELRRGIEEMGPGAYDTLSYYERWIGSIANVLIEKGVLSVDELGRRIEDVRARHAAAPPRRDGFGGGTL